MEEEYEEEWPDYDEENSNMVEDFQGEVNQGPGYEVMTMDTVRKKCLLKMEDLVDLFCMPTDALLLVARHYNWNEE